MIDRAGSEIKVGDVVVVRGNGRYEVIGIASGYLIGELILGTGARSTFPTAIDPEACEVAKR